MKNVKMVRATLVEGTMYERKPGGTLVPLVGRTDHKRLAAMTEREIEAIAANDPDGRPVPDEEWTIGAVRQPAKIPVGLRLDDDVLRWFKDQGRGYQTRINAVLRRYVEARRKAG